MKSFNAHQTQFLKTHTKIGAMIGLTVGSVIGITVSYTVFTLFNSSSVFALGVLAAFALIFAAFGSFMGMLFDLDAYERGVSKAAMVMPRRVRRGRANTPPIAIS